jgi:hypothetical protein
VIAIICGSIFLNNQPSNVTSSPDLKTGISTDLPSPSPSSTVKPIELKVNSSTIDDIDSSKTTLQQFATEKTTEAGNAKRGVQPDTLQPKRNEVNKQAAQPQRKDDQGPQSIRSRTLQWSGTVNRERVVKIDMPGVPGQVEIPRATGCSVAIIEPPTAANNWRHVTLRILGQGDVSFQLRWRPITKPNAGE